jgi:hypothetical protein
MSDYSQVPNTPADSGAVGLFTQISSQISAEEEQRTTGRFLDNKVAEDRIMENVRNGNIPLAISSVAMGAVKGEVCSPAQIKALNKEEKQRYDGVPALQLIQTGIEKATSGISGEEFKFGETTTSIVKRLDTFAKAALTSGASVGVDLLVTAGRDANDAMDCHSGDIKGVPKTPAQEAASRPAFVQDSAILSEQSKNPMALADNNVKSEIVPRIPETKPDSNVIQIFKAPAEKPIEISGLPVTPAQASGLVDSYEQPDTARVAQAPSRTMSTGPSGPGM